MEREKIRSDIEADHTRSEVESREVCEVSGEEKSRLAEVDTELESLGETVRQGLDAGGDPGRIADLRPDATGDRFVSMLIEAARLGRVQLIISDPLFDGPSSVSVELGDEENQLSFRVWLQMFQNRKILSEDAVAVERAWISPSSLTELPVSLELAAELTAIAIEQFEKASLWSGINNMLGANAALTYLSKPPKRQKDKIYDKPIVEDGEW